MADWIIDMLKSFSSKPKFEDIDFIGSKILICVFKDKTFYYPSDPKNLYKSRQA